MSPRLKIVIGALVLLISFDGLRISGNDALGPTAAALFAAIGVVFPFIIGLFIRRRLYRGPQVVGDALLSMWPLCVMRVWPVIAGLKQWDYSYTLSASERDVAGFLLYLSLVSLWSMLSAWSIGGEMKARDADKDIGIELPNPILEQRRKLYKFYGICYGMLIILACPLMLALNRHASFHSKAWDLAIFAQLCYNITHGNGLEVSVRGLTNIFADHFSPIVFPVALLYPLFGGKASALIIIQALAVASGVIPLVLMAVRRSLYAPLYSLLIGLVYATYVPLNFLLIDDFHPIALVVPLILWAFYFLETKRMLLFYIFLVLAGCCQEEAWIIVGMVGLYLALFRGMRRAGLMVFMCSWLFFFWLVVNFIPSFRTEGDYFYIHRYSYLGTSGGEIFKNIFIHPGLWLGHLFDARSFAFIVMMLAPLGFLPLRRPKILFIIIPTIFYTLISGYDIQKSIFHQYTAPFIPFLLLSFVDNFEKSKDANTRLNSLHLPAVAALCSIFAYAMMLLFPIWGHPELFSQSGVSNLYSFLDGYYIRYIKADDKVCTTSKYAPHLSNRAYLTLFPQLEWLGSVPDKILIDGYGLNSLNERKLLTELYLGTNLGLKYELLESVNGIFIFQKAKYSVKPGNILNDNVSFRDGRLSNYIKPENRSNTSGLIPVGIQFRHYSSLQMDQFQLALLRPGDYPDAYYLTVKYAINKKFNNNLFISIRGVDKSDELTFELNVFPIYGMLPIEMMNYSNDDYSEAGTGENHFYQTLLIESTEERNKYISLLKHQGNPKDTMTIMIFPMGLPDGWRNTLDEYVAIQEYAGKVNWDEAYIFNVWKGFFD